MLDSTEYNLVYGFSHAGVSVPEMRDRWKEFSITFRRKWFVEFLRNLPSKKVSMKSFFESKALWSQDEALLKRWNEGSIQGELLDELERSECGTTACCAGWCAYVTAKAEDPYLIGIEFLGLNNEEASAIFFSAGDECDSRLKKYFSENYREFGPVGWSDFGAGNLANALEGYFREQESA